MKPVADRLAELFPEVEPMAYYHQLFPDCLLQDAGDYTQGLYTAITTTLLDDGETVKARRRQLTKGLPQLQELIDLEHFTMTAPVLFAGRNATNNNARYLTALEFDLDFLRMKKGEIVGIEDFLYQTSLTYDGIYNRLPTPTYVIASSDMNLHVVYQLDKPIPLYKFTLDSVRDFRREFIQKLWNSYITEGYKHPQFESSPVQAFRLVGSNTKQGNAKVRCFQTSAKVSVEYMNGYCKHKIKLAKDGLTLEQAKELYPERYERRIEQKQPRKTWQAHKGLYEWWVRQCPRIEVGHRYHYLLCMAAYAQKCGISEERLLEDMTMCRKMLDRISPPDNPLTVADMAKAMQAHQESFRTLPRKTISQLSGLEIPAAKRNGRTQAQHMKIMSAVRDIDYPNGEWRNVFGRPNKMNLVINYKLDNPKASIRDIAKALSISPTTVNKWLKELKDNPKSQEILNLLAERERRAMEQ